MLTRLETGLLTCFASATTRWPAIVTGVIDDLHTSIGELDSSKQEDKIAEGKKILEQVVSLKHELQHDRSIEPLPTAGVASDCKSYNEELSAIGPLTWQSAPWLYSECYLYRKLYTFFELSQHWKSYDIFARQKIETFQKSASAVAELALRYKALAEQLKAHHTNADSEAIQVLFSEFTDISLWGNATDLSLLVTVSLEEIQKLQGAEVRKQNSKNILANDLPAAWEAISSEKGGRVDFVLDNSGFELYTDLVFALFLLDSGLADTIVLHPKSLPWFVSDVLPHDILQLFNLLQDTEAFPDHRADIDYLVEKLIHYHSEGQLVIRTSSFWTTYAPFWDITEKEDPCGGHLVWEDLKDSKLVIFKGDLNYRKLVGDIMWPRTTPFLTAIQDLASSGLRVLTLRTIKADVVAGLAENREQELEKEWAALGNSNPLGWAYSGKYALIQYSSGEN
ncbi:hypothetical protein AWJ20_814 [Sugiyamaella lignohabitans]|uniref:Sugar phosphate phosphatase n=1 Tax=Sugiyamaella lignohabitans TaxID=796027 RepID=A0A161HIX2_9ASCO|nr:uncharacterized protein AWJ20_814 [Sugiyamaella lignohabitans]ANB12557.1 hypothetical protein AWJ20_814 [Sugiyamaella lignohabitans]